MTHLSIGKEGEKMFHLPQHSLLGQMSISGAAGSGKTHTAKVIAEELLMRNISIIAFDMDRSWTGLISPCTTKQQKYRPFHLKKAQGFWTIIQPIFSPEQKIIRKRGHASIVLLNKLDPLDVQPFVHLATQDILQHAEQENNLQTVLIFEEGCLHSATASLLHPDKIAGLGIGAILISTTKETHFPTKTHIQLKNISDKASYRTASLAPGECIISGSHHVKIRPVLHDQQQLTEQAIHNHYQLHQRIEHLLLLLRRRKDDTAFDIGNDLAIAFMLLAKNRVEGARIFIERSEARLSL